MLSFCNTELCWFPSHLYKFSSVSSFYSIPSSLICGHYLRVCPWLYCVRVCVRVHACVIPSLNFIYRYIFLLENLIGPFCFPNIPGVKIFSNFICFLPIYPFPFVFLFLILFCYLAFLLLSIQTRSEF